MTMCLLHRKVIREVMAWVVLMLGISALNQVAVGLPIVSATMGDKHGFGHWPSLPTVARTAVLHYSKKEGHGSSGQLAGKSTEGVDPGGSTLSKNASSSVSTGSRNGTSMATVQKASTNGSLSNTLVGDAVDGTVRVLHESLASSPVDVNMSARGVRGMVKGLSSSVKGFGRNIRKMVEVGNKRSFKVLLRNESMVVVGVSGMRIAEEEIREGRSRAGKVFMDGRKIVVAVRGRDKNGREETREFRINLGGKYKVKTDKVYLVRDGGDSEWSVRIIIPRSKRREVKINKEAEKKCRERYGESEIEGDLCICEKMKTERVSGGDMECVSGIAERFMKTSKDLCEGKKGMQNRYECLVSKLREMGGDGSDLNTGHGRSVLSMSMGMEAGDFEEEDERARVKKEMFKYVVFVIMFGLVVACLKDLKRQCGRYREERGKAREIVRLPEYVQTIYSRMIRG